jgi:hypothetical protein
VLVVWCLFGVLIDASTLLLTDDGALTFGETEEENLALYKNGDGELGVDGPIEVHSLNASSLFLTNQSLGDIVSYLVEIRDLLHNIDGCVGTPCSDLGDMGANCTDRPGWLQGFDCRCSEGYEGVGCHPIGCPFNSTDFVLYDGVGFQPVTCTIFSRHDYHIYQLNFSSLATNNSLISATTCDGTTTMDTMLSLHDAPIFDGSHELVSSDDNCGLQTVITYDLAGLTTVWLQVEGFDGDAGQYTLGIGTCVDGIAGDGEGGIDCGLGCADEVCGS